VGAQIAKALRIPLDLIIPRKIGAPQNPELAVGAVAQDGTTIFNQSLLTYLRLTTEDLTAEIEAQIAEIHRRMIYYRGTARYPSYTGKKIILVDDGVATGYTVRAALRSIRKIFKPPQITLAVPVGPPDTIDELSFEVDHFFCLYKPSNFQAVGQFYIDFTQTTDEEVIMLWRELSSRCNHSI
jgi:predicted phosphoribosyltransferase